MMKKKLNFTFGVGRRKESVARVHIFKGKEESLVNGVPVGKYFFGELGKSFWEKPFILTGVQGKYYFSAKVSGGGKKSQLAALSLGIARSLNKVKTEFRPILKKAGLLTRDARVRQRRMVGTGGKARRKKQSPKR
jgi:small subunit ribosomal protein S9